jgi:hypothetical protein
MHVVCYVFHRAHQIRGWLDRSLADEIAKLFPNLFGQPSASLVPSAEPAATRPLKIGVVLSGGQAPGGHNVICGIFGEYALASCAFQSPKLPRPSCYGANGGDLRLVEIQSSGDLKSTLSFVSNVVYFNEAPVNSRVLQL